MVMCFVPDCNHYSEQGKCKFLPFPVNINERKKWIALIRRHDREPSKWSLVCSCHFVDKNRKNGPTLFEFDKNRRFTFRSGKRKRKVSGRDYKEGSPKDSIPKEKTAATNIDDVATNIDEAATKIDEAATNIDEAPTNIDAAEIKIEGAATNIDKAAIKIEEAPKNIDEVEIKMEELATNIDEAAIKIEEAPTNIDVEIKMEEVVTNIDEAAIKIEKAAMNVDEAPTNIDEAATNIDVSMPSTSNSLQGPSTTLEVENYFLKQEVEELKLKLKNIKTRFSYENIENNDSHILMYTGIPTNALFLTVVETIDRFKYKYYANWIVGSLPKIDQILMTLMKLRLNLPDEDLALRFECSAATVANIVMTWIQALHKVFFTQLKQTIPLRKKNQACLDKNPCPPPFTHIQNCKIILNSTKIYSATSTGMENQKVTSSSYKHRNTWKILVGVATNGVISFVSEAYPGSTSDVKIIENCGILKQMVSGDLILADKGSIIKDSPPKGVSLNIPPISSTPKITEPKVHDTQQLAKARIHVERAISRIKCYQILLLVPHNYISQISIIFQLCAALSNFQYPLIKEVGED